MGDVPSQENDLVIIQDAHPAIEVQEGDAAIRALKTHPVWKTLAAMIGPLDQSRQGAMQ